MNKAQLVEPVSSITFSSFFLFSFFLSFILAFPPNSSITSLNRFKLCLRIRRGSISTVQINQSIITVPPSCLSVSYPLTDGGIFSTTRRRLFDVIRNVGGISTINKEVKCHSNSVIDSFIGGFIEWSNENSVKPELLVQDFKLGPWYISCPAYPFVILLITKFWLRLL